MTHVRELVADESLMEAFVLAVALALLAAQGPPTPAALIAGTWHGTSSCLDRLVDRACQNEEVVYQIDSAAGPRGPVTIRADKVVNGVRQPTQRLIRRVAAHRVSAR